MHPQLHQQTFAHFDNVDGVSFYDGLDRRITSTVSGTTTVLFYSAAWQALEESVASVYTQRYVWSPVYVNALILRDTDLTGTGLTASGTEGTDFSRLWVVQDANWNVVALVSASGTVVERYDYTPFGVVIVVSGSVSGWVYLFQGGRQDSVTGDYSFQMRDYDPVLERWMTIDPRGLAAQDSDLYRFVMNLPTSNLDFSGLQQANLTLPPQPVVPGLGGFWMAPNAPMTAWVQPATAPTPIGGDYSIGVSTRGAVFVPPSIIMSQRALPCQPPGICQTPVSLGMTQ